jgi:hypothetical protein
MGYAMPWARKLECEALESDPVCRPSRPVFWSRARRTQPPALYGPQPPRARSLCEQRLSPRTAPLLRPRAALRPRPLSRGRRGQSARSLPLSTALGRLAPLAL